MEKKPIKLSKNFSPDVSFCSFCCDMISCKSGLASEKLNNFISKLLVYKNNIILKEIMKEMEIIPQPDFEGN